MKLLMVTGNGFIAGAQWEKRRGEWACVNSAPIIKWMRGMSPRSAVERLKRSRLAYEWINNPAYEGPAGHAPSESL